MNKQILSVALAIVAVTLFSCGENKFKTLKSGLEYKIVKKGKDGKKIAIDNMITMDVIAKLKDSVLFDSHKMNDNKPVPVKVSKPGFNGDLMEGLTLLSVGDSAIFNVPIDSFPQEQRPPFAKKGDKFTYIVKIVSSKTNEEFEKEQMEADSKQGGIDDKLIQDYVAANNLQAQKTPSGIYYVITKVGNGKHPVATDKVKVNYKGTLLDGTKFDSSYDHGKPVDFPLNQVIKGWTEGIPLLDEGGKGTLIIPSSLAYGKNPPQGAPIKPNTVLVFEVELLEILK